MLYTHAEYFPVGFMGYRCENVDISMWLKSSIIEKNNVSLIIILHFWRYRCSASSEHYQCFEIALHP